MLTNAREFVVGGNATFTIVPATAYLAAEPDAKPWYTYRVRQKKVGRWKGDWFADLLTGPDNGEDFSPLGRFNPNTGEIRLTSVSRFTERCRPFVIVNRVLRALWEGRQGQIEAGGWQVKHEGRCGRCGRKLTVPSSLDSGFGPECIQIVAGIMAA